LLGLIFKNLWRQRIRNGLTLVGISLGIATIVALGLVSHGFEQDLGASLRSGDIDFSLISAQASAILFSTVAEQRVAEIAQQPGVGRAIGTLVTVAFYQNNPYFVTIGLGRADLELTGVRLIDGRLYSDDSPDELLMGTIAARSYGLHLDDSIELSHKTFHIVGIYQTGNVWEDGGAIMPLSTLQAFQHREGQVTMIGVKVATGSSVEAVEQAVEGHYSEELAAMRSLSESEKTLKTLGIVRVLGWAVSLLAVAIGGLGVMNTLIMAVFERTREIGVLRAVGWRRNRILRMILGESLVLSLVAIFVGGVGGAIAVRLLLFFPWARGIISPTYAPDILVQAVIVALGVGLLGGFYPAYRASRISPREALHYE
jgi:putative ABC transport system permease protein